MKKFHCVVKYAMMIENIEDRKNKQQIIDEFVRKHKDCLLEVVVRSWKVKRLGQRVTVKKPVRVRCADCDEKGPEF